MKRMISLCLCASVFNLTAALPLRWTVETSRAVPAQFEAYQGETLALEAALQSYGKPLEAPLNYSLYWQTNGMGSAYWSAPCTVPSRPSATGAVDSTVSNVLHATWSPTNDVGARVYNCFIGQPGTIYHAAFQLRLRPSPGSTPNELPLPQKVIDFAKVTVLNPPWSGGGGGGVDTNAVREIVGPMIGAATNDLSKTLSDSMRDKTDLDVYGDVLTDEWTCVPDISPYRVQNAVGVIAWRVVDENGNPASIEKGYDEPLVEELTWESNESSLGFRFVATRIHGTGQTGDRLATTKFVSETYATKTALDETDIKATDAYLYAQNAEGFAIRAEGTANTALAGLDNLSSEVHADYARKTEIEGKQDALPYPTNAIPAEVIVGLEPQSLPYLRVFDEVRQCWWIGTMVNGVINWEVE